MSLKRRSPSREQRKTTGKQKDEQKKSPCNPKARKEKTAKSQDSAEQLTMRYTLKKDGSGMIEASLTPICVESSETVAIMSRHQGLKIVPHHNILQSLFVHRKDVVARSGYYKYDTTLEQYLKRLAIGTIRGYCNDKIVMEYAVPSNMVSLKDAMKFNYVPEVYRNIIRGVIKGVCHLHLGGLFLNELDLAKNFAVLEGTVKLYALDFVTPVKSESRKQSWVLVKKVIQKMFTTGGKKEPEDIIHLYECMENTSDVSGEHLLRCHLAILGTEKRLEMIRKFHEKKTYFDPKLAKAYTLAVRNSGLTKNWNKDLDANIVGYGPILDCYYKTHEGATPYSGTSNGDLLRFARNMVVHLKDEFRKHTHKNHAETRNPTEHDVDILIMMMFGVDLLKFQQILNKKNLLKHFAKFLKDPDSY